ncbi:hypothetical protein ScPMuIL_001136 [Solemya velum]
MLRSCYQPLASPRDFLKRILPKKRDVFGKLANTKYLSSTPDVVPQRKSVPREARVVICGGGVIGSSVAYHLSERGWTDVVVLEQGSLTCGTTWHSAGLIGQARQDFKALQTIKYSRNLYKSLEEAGHGLGWRECGSVQVARTRDRLTQLQVQHQLANAIGVECHIVGPSEVDKLCPLIKTEDLTGALYVPGDGFVTAPDVAMALFKLAKAKGVKVFENVQVKTIKTENRRVSRVETTEGDIQCDYFVNCAGLWAHELGKCTTPKVAVPLHACEHFALITKPIDGVDAKMPVVRDHDGKVYFREWNGGIFTGGFETQGKPVFHTAVPEKFEFQLLPEDWDHFQELLDEMLHRIPLLETAQIRQMVNGPESFTPDAHWIIGEAAEVDNYFVAAGMHSSGVQGAGGIGRYLADWIIEGEKAVTDMWSHDIRRFVVHHNNRKFLKSRVKETIATYNLRYPLSYWKSGRRLRMSPLHTRLENEGAVFGEKNAFERPLFFTRSEEEFTEMQLRTFRKPYWFKNVQEEYLACKERVTLIDMSSFTKIEIKSDGPEAKDFLQYLCSNNIDRPVGTVTLTGMQNIYGGYENDCTLMNVDHNFYLMTTPTSQQTRSLTWLRKKLPSDVSVNVRDVTSMYSSINVIGPHAQPLLAELSDTDVSMEAFKPMTSKIIDVGNAGGIKALRLTHAGEDGFMLYVPSEFALHIYDALMSSGRDYGICNAGLLTLKHLRLEKLFPYWGKDLTSSTTPLECGHEFLVDFKNGDFYGKEALLTQKEEGVSKRFAQFLLEDFDINTDIWPLGGEVIYRNGKFVGTATTTGFGFSLNKMVCLGFVNSRDEHGQPVKLKNINEFVMDRNAVYEIGIAGKKFRAKVGIYTPQQAYVL